MTTGIAPECEGGYPVQGAAVSQKRGMSLPRNRHRLQIGMALHHRLDGRFTQYVGIFASDAEHRMATKAVELGP